MTLEEFLTLPLSDRIKWLHGDEGPRGYLSHDRFAAELGTNRQTVIAWEKGTEPRGGYADKLADFSGFPSLAFRRREAEAAAAAFAYHRLQDHARRLQALEAETERQDLAAREFGAAVVRRLDALEAALATATPRSTPQGSEDRT